MMRWPALLALALALFPAAHPQELQKTQAQLAAERAEAAEAEVRRQELITLERETVRAFQMNNTAFIQRVYSDDFIGTTNYGQDMDKAALKTSMQLSDTKYSTFLVTNIKIRTYQDIAVVLSTWTMRGVWHGETFSRQSRVIHVYVFGQGGWRTVASQEARLPGQGK